MGLGNSFGEDGKIYGLLYPMGTPNRVCWEMSFYATKRGRKMGLAYLHKLLGLECPIMQFEFTLNEIRDRAVLSPFIPPDRSINMEKFKPFL